MRCLLIYDIPDDNARTKVADVCLDYGLDRIQYSAFLGQLNRGLQEELLMRIQKRMGRKAGNIQLIPICATDWQARLSHIEEAPDDDEESNQDVGVNGKPAKAGG